MNDRERMLAVLNYQPYDRLPIVHFGYWDETLDMWAEEGHIDQADADGWADNNVCDYNVSKRLGFDFNWASALPWNTRLEPPFEEHVVERYADGSRAVLNKDGVIVLEKDGMRSIQHEIQHLLDGRQGWQEVFLPRLQWTPVRLDEAEVHLAGKTWPFDQGGREALLDPDRPVPYGVNCGSLFGRMRNWVGLVPLSYMLVDDEPLVDEMIETVADLLYQGVKIALETGIRFDFGHFWEDICFTSGPLVSPTLLAAKIGRHYRRITDLLHSYGVDLVSLDCDGKIDAMIPIWLENGVNVMFPIEVGTWGASIEPWRRQYGRALRGVGGMDKRVFAYDYAAVDAEIERLRPLIELGGFIPCPDHRLAPDARWENVQYYCERLRRLFD